MSTPPRYLPEEALPPYAYVPGRFPHPFSDPQGHSYQLSSPPVPPPDPWCWAQCQPYLRALDLFHHGYYWEAHEAWEALWHACGRRGDLADFFKGLIQLAVAGVKLRQGRPEGVRSHAERAAELFQKIAGEKTMMGLALADLLEASGRCATAAVSPTGLLPVLLLPTQEPS
jgi:uncharacterized protein